MEPDRLSREIAEKLETARMTAEALSLSADLARDTVGRWMRGTTVPTLASLRSVEAALADRLGCLVDLSAAVKERRSARSHSQSPRTSLASGPVEPIKSLMTYDPFERGRSAERLTDAINLIGSSSVDTRFGAIYLLERIAHDSATDHPAIMEILDSFVRRRATLPRNEDPDAPTTAGCVLEYDIQAALALTVIARRNASQDVRPVNLGGANLSGAHMEGADLRSADLRRTILRGAHLHGADLSGAFFFEADLGGAYLHGANMRGANLRWVNMEHAWANRTDFRGAIFWGANLQMADLHEADLRGADLSRKEVMHMTPPGASYSMTHLKGPFPEGWKEFSSSFPAVKMHGANLLGAKLEGANLQGVEGLTDEQLSTTVDHSADGKLIEGY